MNAPDQNARRPFGRFTGLSIVIGVAIGAAVGAATGAMGVWVGGGAGLGLLLGPALDWCAGRKAHESKSPQ